MIRKHPFAAALTLTVLLIGLTAATYQHYYMSVAELDCKVLSVAGVFTPDAEVVLPADGVALTSPTVTFSVADKALVTLTADANLTGITPTGGVVGQLVIIRAGAGSNTLRFDDNATTFSLGSNVTLTEGQDDVLGLVCTGVNATSGNNTWASVFARDN